jgi:maltokinase
VRESEPNINSVSKSLYTGQPDPELWRHYLTSARWFQGKGLPVGDIRITPLPWYGTRGSVAVRSEFAQVSLGDRVETYHLLVGYLPAGRGEPAARVGRIGQGRHAVDIVDAPRSPRAMRTLLGALTRPHATGVTWYGSPVDPDSPTQVFTGEQSNTTVRIGESHLLKIFRKLVPGANLEAETMAALAPSPIIPQLLGTWSATSDERYDLGVFVERIDKARDGWAFCVEAGTANRSVASEMTALGRTLRTLHADLARAYGVSVVDSATISHRFLDGLGTASTEVPELAARRDTLATVLRLPPGDTPVQRVHGDFHLGQALLAPRGWTIIDFEGEPLKTPAERAAPDAVWRDVAGLTRSLDYARATAHASEQWYAEARAAFLSGYSEVPVPSPLLAAYETDKAIYELVYEVRNRPDWAAIPRQALDTTSIPMKPSPAGPSLG